MQQIKKFFLSLMFCSALIGCSSTSTKNIDTPDTITIGKNTISYFDKKNTIENNYDNITVDFKDSSADEWFSSGKGDFEILCNDDIIRAFVITNKNIETMHGIHVGDKLSKIEEILEYEHMASDKLCAVLFNGITETNDYDNAQNNWLWINYLADDNGIITKIMITDYEFAKYLK